jgi:hypothetical protein
VLERHKPSLTKQQHIAALLSALPLANPAVLTHWQENAKAYPHALSVAMVQAHLHFRPAWAQETLAERGELLALYESFCLAQKRMLLVFMGLNHPYYPGWQWTNRLMGQMPIAPQALPRSSNKSLLLSASIHWLGSTNYMTSLRRPSTWYRPICLRLTSHRRERSFKSDAGSDIV